MEPKQLFAAATSVALVGLGIPDGTLETTLLLLSRLVCFAGDHVQMIWLQHGLQCLPAGAYARSHRHQGIPTESGISPFDTLPRAGGVRRFLMNS